MIPVQAAIGGKVVAREFIKGLKKMSLQKFMEEELQIERENYLKNKKNKARSKQFGKVGIPQEAFIGVLKINKES